MFVQNFSESLYSVLDSFLIHIKLFILYKIIVQNFSVSLCMFYDSGIPYSYLNSHGIRIRVDYSGWFATVTQNTECPKKQIRDYSLQVTLGHSI